MSKLLKLLVAVSVLAVSSLSFAKSEGDRTGGDKGSKMRDNKGSKMDGKGGHDRRDDRRDDRRGDDSGSDDVEAMKMEK